MLRLNRNKAGFGPSLPQPLSGRSSGTRTGFFAIAALAFSFFLSFDHSFIRSFIRSFNQSFFHSFILHELRRESNLPPSSKAPRARQVSAAHTPLAEERGLLAPWPACFNQSRLCGRCFGPRFSTCRQQRLRKASIRPHIHKLRPHFRCAFASKRGLTIYLSN